MKKVFFAFAILALLADFSAAQEWVQTNGTGEGQLNTVVFNSRKDLFTAGDGVIMKSEDHGKTWTRTGPKIPYSIFRNIAITPNGDLFSGCSGYNTNHLYGLYKSTDNGGSWSLIKSETPYYLKTDHNGIIYALVLYLNQKYRYTCLSSSDGGKTWDSTTIPIDDINTLDIDSNGVVICSYYNSLYRSTDKGKTLEKVRSFQQNIYCTSIVAGKGSNVYVSATQPTSSIHSTDDGKTWLTLPFGQGLFAQSPSGRVLFVGSGVIKYSDDNGLTWNDFGGITQGIDGNGYLTFLAADADSGFYFVINHKTYHANSPGINPWEITTMPTGSIYSMICQKGNLIASSGGGRIWLSDNRGEAWSLINDSIGGENARFVIDSNKDILLFNEHAMYRSTDNGITWTLINSLGSKDRYSSAVVHPNGDIFASYGTSVSKSSDHGQTWQKINNFTTGATSLITNSYGQLYAGAGNNLYYSLDTGKTWQSQPFDSSIHGQCTVTCMSVDHYGSLFVFLQTDNSSNGLYRSIDNGMQWSKLNKGFNNISKHVIFNIVIAPNNVALAISDSGAYELDSEECTWKEYSNGLFSNIWYDNGAFIFRTLSLCVDSSGTLYAGAFGSGVFKSIEKFNNQFKLIGLIKSSDLEFDTVFVNNTVCSNIILTNVGLAPFTLTKYNLIDPIPFSVDPKSASILPIILKPRDSVIMRICFHPPQPADYASEIDWNTDIDVPPCTGMKYQSFIHGIAIQKSSVQTSSPSEIIFFLHPNPVSGNFLTVSFPESQSQPVALSVYDVLGREVYRNNILPGLKEFDIPIRDLSEGMYYVRVESNGETTTEKFIKMK